MKRVLQHSSLFSFAIGLFAAAPALAMQSSPSSMLAIEGSEMNPLLNTSAAEFVPDAVTQPGSETSEAIDRQSFIAEAVFPSIAPPPAPSASTVDHLTQQVSDSSVPSPTIASQAIPSQTMTSQTIADPDAGLFNGQYGALAQLIVYPTDTIRLGFTYINSYTPLENDFGLATGSNAANDDFGRPVSVNSYGISGTIDITEWLAIGGWVGYSHHRYIGRGDGDVWTWAGSLSFPDLFGDGNMGGIFVGQEPRLARVDASVPGAEADDDTSLHLEAFYRYRLSNNIDITPGVIWLTAPNHNADNEDVIIGVVRTKFFF